MEVGVKDAPLQAAAGARMVRALLFGSGLVFVLTALFYNEWTLEILGSAELSPFVRAAVRRSQLLFALMGGLFFLAFEGVRRVRWLRTLAAHRGVPQVLLMSLSLLLPISILELGLRPFVVPKTTLFVPDPDLGWRPRPGAVDEWGHVRVEINQKGLRGPEVAWEKPRGVLRILYLGDSVTFGYGLEKAEDSYPYRVGADLEGQLQRPVETINSGVGGWSPWQQYAFLEREGLRYQPDLIVVGFVLNDVTEKFGLISFGGLDESWQLQRTAQSWLDGWLSRSALLSSLRDGFAVLRFGREVFFGAQRYEAEEIRWLAANARDESLEEAWAVTLENLGQIFATAAERKIPAALIVFPFAFQVADPLETAGPQEILRDFAAANGIAMLDLLPILAAESRTGEPLFLDPSHLSRQGSRVAATAIARFLRKQRLVTPEATTQQGPKG